MMKVAVANDKGMVSEHFGHCEGFMVFNSNKKEILNEERIANPGHRPRFLPNFLNDIGVNVIISGGMGASAIDIFNGKNIEVVVGARGNARRAVKDYLTGALKSTGSVCHQHQHHDECGE